MDLECLICPTCKNIIKSPKRLLCEDIICQSCLRSHIRRDLKIDGDNILDFLGNRTPTFEKTDKNVLCPGVVKGDECKQSCSPFDENLPAERFIDLFHNSLKCQTLLDLYHGKNAGNCINCSQVASFVKASHACIEETCISLLCNKCAFIHCEVYDTTHKVVALADIWKSAHNQVTDATGGLTLPINEKCKLHMELHSLYVCKNCLCECCVKCVQTSHKNCEVLVKSEQNLQTPVTTLTAQLREMSNTLKTEHEKASNNTTKNGEIPVDQGLAEMKRRRVEFLIARSEKLNADLKILETHVDMKLFLQVTNELKHIEKEVSSWKI